MACGGIALGVVAAFAVGRFLESRLFGISLTDPIALGAASAVLVAVVLAVSSIPAHRAAHADTAALLREE